MHEWALAEAVISTVIKTARERGLGKITDININLGQLQQIESDIFEFALKEIIQSQKPLFKNVKIQLREEKAVLKCRACGHEWPFGDNIRELDHERSEAIHFVPEAAHAYIRCPKCESPDFEILKGRGVWIDSITGE